MSAGLPAQSFSAKFSATVRFGDSRVWPGRSLQRRTLRRAALRERAAKAAWDAHLGPLVSRQYLRAGAAASCTRATSERRPSFHASWFDVCGAYGRARLQRRASPGPSGSRGGAALPPEPPPLARDVVDGGGAGRDCVGVAPCDELRALPRTQGEPLPGHGPARGRAAAGGDDRRRGAPYPDGPGEAFEELVRRRDRGGPRRRPLRRVGRRGDADGRSASRRSPFLLHGRASRRATFRRARSPRVHGCR